MRLICPNCDAQYEVGAGVIPPEGRDVQCSNCGHIWFTRAEDLEAQPAPEAQAPGTGAAREPEPEAEDRAKGDAAPVDSRSDKRGEEPTRKAAPKSPAPAAAAPAASAASADDEFEQNLRDALGGDEPPDAAEVSATPASSSSREADDFFAGAQMGGYEEDYEAAPGAVHTRRELDPDIAEVLRQEAEREAAARRSETNTPLETQTDLGLDERQDTRAGAARARMAQVSGRAAAAAAATGAVRARPGAPDRDDRDGGRDLLPDIEEINSSLRSGGARRSGDTPVIEELEVENSRKQGFRLGFVLVVLLIGLLWAAYAYAPAIVERVPESGAIMQRYVDAVNVLRVELDGLTRTAVEAIQRLTG
ncbi:zinc-ribbon domain-containing protein [Brevirhabdus sp.]|uniref:zinc-ribbon domain-containing protein n=1 Tax=Brevirhabdus sp. TaxID=2004514 RepID=UPI0040590E0B